MVVPPLAARVPGSNRCRHTQRAAGTVTVPLSVAAPEMVNAELLAIVRFVENTWPGEQSAEFDGDDRIGRRTVDEDEVAGHRSHTARPPGAVGPVAGQVAVPHLWMPAEENTVSLRCRNSALPTAPGNIVLRPARPRRPGSCARDGAAGIDGGEQVTQHGVKPPKLHHAGERPEFDDQAAGDVDGRSWDCANARSR